MVAWNFVELDSVGSTQAIARSLAATGAPEGTTVVARSQSAGAGRLGRSWASPSGGLYMSFILRPEKLAEPELATLVSALAVVEGVEQSTGLVTKIRWPNDVMADGKKLAGVIAEGGSSKGEVVQIIVGVGVNCNAPVPAALADEAISLAQATGKTIQLAELKHMVLDSFSRLYPRWMWGEDMLPLWKAHVATVGKQVLVKLKKAENPLASVAERVDADGSLVLSSNGKETVLRVEDMEWLREQP